MGTTSTNKTSVFVLHVPSSTAEETSGILCRSHTDNSEALAETKILLEQKTREYSELLEQHEMSLARYRHHPAAVLLFW